MQDAKRHHTISRRQFMGVSFGGALGSFWATGAHANGGMLDDDKTLHIGVVGCGHRGMRHVAHLKALFAGRPDRLKLLLCDHDANRLKTMAARAVAKPYRTWRDMLAEATLDGVIVATPDAVHAPIAQTALRHGAAVFCEPPLAMTAHEAREVYEAAIAAERPLFMAVDQAWSREMSDVRSALGGMRQEDFHRIDGTFATYQRTAGAQRPEEAAAWRRSPKQSMGPAAVAHYVGLYSLLTAVRLGLPQQASTAAQSTAFGIPELPDTLLSTLDYPGGVKLHTTVAAGGIDGVVRFRGPARDVKLALPPNTDGIASDNRQDSALGQWLQAVAGGESAPEMARLAYETQVAVHLALFAAKARSITTLDALAV